MCGVCCGFLMFYFFLAFELLDICVCFCLCVFFLLLCGGFVLVCLCLFLSVEVWLLVCLCGCGGGCGGGWVCVVGDAQTADVLRSMMLMFVCNGTGASDMYVLFLFVFFF